jgi:peptidoglycan/xylan/chitin deacetylase (PgdA/CDA1 family)
MHSLVKEGLFRGLGISGVNALLHRRGRDRLLVLNYHGVVPEDRSRDRFGYQNTVSAAELDWHLRLLCRHFHPVSIGHVRNWVEGREALPSHPVLVTFDDGYRNNLTYAARLLKKHAVPAVVFLSTGYVGNNRMLWPSEIIQRVLRWPHASIVHPTGSPELPFPNSVDARRTLASQLCEAAKRMPDSRKEFYLDYLREHTSLGLGDTDEILHTFLNWDEVRALRQFGIDFGAHTVNHVICTQVSTEILDRELLQSKSDIERELGVECFSMAYPNGSPLDFSDSVIDRVRKVGYRLAFTLTNETHDRSIDPLKISRLQVPGHVSHATFEVRVCGTLAFLRKMQAWKN